jgi:hypothetical protein
MALAVVCGRADIMAADPQAPDFRFEIRPIVAKNCFACHGPDESHRQADLRLDERDVAVELGSIVPGAPDESELVRRILSDVAEERMPPPETGHTLTADEIDKLKRWIAAGADYSRHWSYEPPRRPDLPNVTRADWCRNDIDRFVLARMEQVSLAPEPEADRPRLIRRLSLDLTGLPPTLEEVDEFVADDSPDAYERLVDRLLSSPAYGEHWARKWLDLARYADTVGYEKDATRKIWAFRDWVIHALNADMPFDQFTIEQLAGDMLPNATDDQIIATAFHRNTMQNDEGGTDDEEYRVAAVVDRVNTTMQVWMATTMGCCQCHSHKYDPLSHREYYEMFAFFNQTADADRPDQEPLIVTATAEQRKLKTELDRQLAAVQSKYDAQVAVVAKGDEDLAKHKKLKRLAKQRKKLEDQLAKEYGPDRTPIMKELAGDQRRKTHLLIRGSFLNPGEEVSPGTPAVFPAFGEDRPRGRLGLAQWLVDRDNPLTARVVANRQWEQLFGAGIVFTSEDFGSQGMLPTHPELLDWLAIELMDNGWSLKKLTKTIVMSAAYRQSSQSTPEKLARDPGNRLISRGPRDRLSAEQIRDQALFVSGLLSRKIGGPSVMPPQPDGLWQVVYSSDQWLTSQGDDRYRRGLYTFWRRTNPYPSAMALDATSRETCTIRRVSTNTPIAAFALLNDPVYVEAAQSLAREVVKFAGADAAARATYAFRRVLARPPAVAEVERLVKFFEAERQHYERNADAARKLTASGSGEPSATPEGTKTEVAELAAWTVVSNVLLNLDETLNN